MRNVLSFFITAKDEVSPALKRIEAELATLFQKLATAQTAELGAIQKEINALLTLRNKIAKQAPDAASGQAKTLNFLKGVGGFAEKALGHVSKLGAALGVLGGAGLTAGLIENQRRFANLAHSIGIDSRLSGVSPQRLQSLQNAGSILGVEPAAISGSLASINDVMSSIRAGLPEGAGARRDMAAMQRAGYMTAGDANASPDVLFDKLRTAIGDMLAHGQMAQAQMVAGDFHLDIGSLAPVLLASQKDWRATQERAGAAAKPLSDADLAKGETQNQASNERSLAMLNLGNDVAKQLADSTIRMEQSVEKLIQSLDGPVVAGAKHLSTALDEASLHPLLTESAMFAASWAANGVFTLSALSGLNKIRKAMGLKAVAEKAAGSAAADAAVATAGDAAATAPGVAGTVGEAGLAATLEEAGGAGLLTTLGLPVAVAGATGVAMYEIAKHSPPIAGGVNVNLANRGHAAAASYPRHAASADDYRNDMHHLMGAGLTRNQAAGLLGNEKQESGGDPFAIGDHGTAFGLFQLHKDRQAQFEKLFGHSLSQSTRSEQLDYALWELRHTEKNAGDRFFQTTTARDAASVIRKYDERPRDANGQEDAIRGDYADQFANMAPEVPIAPIAAQAASTGPAGKGVVEVKITGAPASSKVTSHGDNFRVSALPTVTPMIAPVGG